MEVKGTEEGVPAAAEDVRLRRVELVGSVDGDDSGVENEREGDGGGEPRFFRVEVFVTVGGFRVMGFLEGVFLTTNFFIGGFQKAIFLR